MSSSILSPAPRANHASNHSLPKNSAAKLSASTREVSKSHRAKLYPPGVKESLSVEGELERFPVAGSHSVSPSSAPTTAFAVKSLVPPPYQFSDALCRSTMRSAAQPRESYATSPLRSSELLRAMRNSQSPSTTGCSHSCKFHLPSSIRSPSASLSTSPRYSSTTQIGKHWPLLEERVASAGLGYPIGLSLGHSSQNPAGERGSALAAAVASGSAGAKSPLGVHSRLGVTSGSAGAKSPLGVHSRLGVTSGSAGAKSPLGVHSRLGVAGSAFEPLRFPSAAIRVPAPGSSPRRRARSASPIVQSPAKRESQLMDGDEDQDADDPKALRAALIAQIEQYEALRNAVLNDTETSQERVSQLEVAQGDLQRRLAFAEQENAKLRAELSSALTH